MDQFIDLIINIIKLIAGLIAPFVILVVILGILNFIYNILSFPKTDGGYYEFFRQHKSHEYFIVFLSLIIVVFIYVFIDDWASNNQAMISESIYDILNFF